MNGTVIFDFTAFLQIFENLKRILKNEKDE